ncbi:hypothetical protein GPJ56_002255 [Histomonas meleagridis]|uniref:uncharacterized protein n=1 Tax=Histomonas meleagridis TaxID=135588 RepID=UPI00355A99DA|nr:hypothetical protein GPJ56_002255 [Histomonas meleagridis]KAH0802947.1 hypothetical protein GO595_004454 [Histomonas meleagridis]
MNKKDKPPKIKDCSQLNFNTWLGPIPQVDPADIPVDNSPYQYPPNFANDFNKHSVNAVKNAKSIGYSQYLTYVYDIAPYLFYCPGIHPRALTMYFFSMPSQAPALFYFYFSSISLEYVPLAVAIRTLLSRISFPKNMAQVLVIIDSFADAYHTANPFLYENKSDIVKIVNASIVLTLNRRGEESMSCTSFLSILQSTKSPTEDKERVYEYLKSNPIPLFFGFVELTSEPNMAMCGELTKIGSGSLLKRKKKRLFQLTGYTNVMQSFKGKEKNELSLEIPLTNIKVKYIPANQKDPSHFILKSGDGNPFGKKYANGKVKPSKNNFYTFYANNDKDVRHWVDMINLVSFHKLIKELAK